MAELSFFDRVATHTTHVPDVLSCIANLSNDEVFTPPEVVNRMLDMLPQELFADPKTTFLDPASKTGVFLREIAKRCLDAQLPNYKERSTEIAEKKKLGIPLDEYDLAFQEQLQAKIDHIFHNQLFGIGITELTSLLSRRSLYCSKYPHGPYSITHFDNGEGNIRFRRTEHIWEPKKLMYDTNGKKIGKCSFCGASRNEYDRGATLESHAYEFIHTVKPEEIWNMKFDVVISNPPYQLSDGGSAGGAIPIYQKFVEQAKKLNPTYLTMIIPSRWFAGGRGLDEFRNTMLNDDSIETLVDYPKSRECFAGVDIAGGVCYFLKKKGYHGECHFVSVSQDKASTRSRKLNEFDVFIRDNIGIDIIHKIQSKHKRFMREIVEPVSPFGLRSFTRGESTPFTNCVTVISSAGRGYLNRNEVKKGLDIIDKYKVCVGYLNPDRAGVNNASDGKSSVTTKINIYKPGEVITETYIVLGAFDTLEEAKNCASYIQTSFARFLVLLTLSSMHITKLNFQFVPLVDFSKTWTDDELNEMFELTKEEVNYIDSLVRPIMILGGDE